MGPVMARRPAIRKSDFKAALAAAIALGLKPSSARFHRDGEFSPEFDDQGRAPSDDLDDELAAFEARNGQG